MVKNAVYKMLYDIIRFILNGYFLPLNFFAHFFCVRLLFILAFVRQQRELEREIDIRWWCFFVISLLKVPIILFKFVNKIIDESRTKKWIAHELFSHSSREIRVPNNFTPLARRGRKKKRIETFSIDSHASISNNQILN